MHARARGPLCACVDADLLCFSLFRGVQGRRRHRQPSRTAEGLVGTQDEQQRRWRLGRGCSVFHGEPCWKHTSRGAAHVKHASNGRWGSMQWCLTSRRFFGHGGVSNPESSSPTSHHLSRSSRLSAVTEKRCAEASSLANAHQRLSAAAFVDPPFVRKAEPAKHSPPLIRTVGRLRAPPPPPHSGDKKARQSRLACTSVSTRSCAGDGWKDDSPKLTYALLWHAKQIHTHMHTSAGAHTHWQTPQSVARRNDRSETAGRKMLTFGGPPSSGQSARADA